MATLEEYEAEQKRLLSPRAEKLLSGEAFHARRSAGPQAYMPSPDSVYNPYTTGKPYGLQYGVSVPGGDPQEMIAHAEAQSRAGKERMLDLAYRISAERAKQLPEIDPMAAPKHPIQGYMESGFGPADVGLAATGLAAPLVGLKWGGKALGKLF